MNLREFVQFYSNIMVSETYRKKCSETNYTWYTVKYITGDHVSYPVYKT
jgi:hypothetical protein